MFLVVNKIDLIPGFEMASDKEEALRNMNYYEQVKDFADSKRLQIFWISARLEMGVKEMFDDIKEKCFKGKIKGMETTSKKNLSLSLVNPKE